MGLSTNIKALGFAVATLVASTPAAFAQQVDGWGRWWWRWWGRGHWHGHGHGHGHGGRGGSNAVPEIDASAGLLAVAAVLATLALAWELRRHRQKNTQ